MLCLMLCSFAPFWTTLNKMARRGEAHRDLWDLVYVNFQLCSGYALNMLQLSLIQSEIKSVVHCYIRLLHLRIIHLILQTSSGLAIICDYQLSHVIFVVKLISPHQVFVCVLFVQSSNDIYD